MNILISIWDIVILREPRASPPTVLFCEQQSEQLLSILFVQGEFIVLHVLVVFPSLLVFLSAVMTCGYCFPFRWSHRGQSENSAGLSAGWR